MIGESCVAPVLASVLVYTIIDQAIGTVKLDLLKPSPGILSYVQVDISLFITHMVV